MKKIILSILEKFIPNYIKLGDDCLISKQYLKAIEYYKKASLIKPNNSILHYNLATCLYALGRYDEAIKQFEITVKLDPNLLDAHLNWGLALFVQNQIAESMEKFETCIKMNPKDSRAFFNYGLTLEKINKIPEAENMYKKVLEISTQNSENNQNKRNLILSLNQLALIDLKKSNFKDSIHKYQELLKLDNLFSPAYYNIAIAFTKINKFDYAIKNLEMFISLNPDGPQKILTEPIFTSLMQLPEFKKLKLS